MLDLCIVYFVQGIKDYIIVSTAYLSCLYVKMLSGKSLVLITGASKGYGLQLAKDIAVYLGEGSNLVMIARNKQSLFNSITDIKNNIKTDNICIRGIVFDLSNISNVEMLLDECTDGLDVSSFDSYYLFHNAGSVGEVSKPLAEISDPELLMNYFNLNLISVQVLTSKFMCMLGKINESKKYCCVINISSLCAVQAFPGMGLYCTGKSARDMFFKVLAAENPEMRFLNWAPGPMPTDMMKHLSDKVCIESTKTAFNNMMQKKTFVECHESVAKLIKVLQENTFSSGAHLDFYDV